MFLLAFVLAVFLVLNSCLFAAGNYTNYNLSLCVGVSVLVYFRVWRGKSCRHSSVGFTI